MTVCESDSGLCWDLDEETLARAILTFCLNTADALMTALLKGTADAWEALTLIRDSDPELRTSAGAGKVIEQAFCIGMTRWGSKPTPQAVRSFRSALATWQQRLRTLPTWDRDYLCGWFTMEGRQWIIAPHDVWWPTRLNDLALLGRCAPPLCLWGSGDRAALTSCPQPVGIVGSRGVNEYGRRLTTDIAVHAAQAGHLVVSGGAMGADAAAHRGALDAMRAYGIGRAGRTVAVFAGGLNHAGPQCNSELFDGIAENGGALVSELCPGTIPEARRFLSRNRIIAALSSTLVVTQARLRSGALNTVNWEANCSGTSMRCPATLTCRATAAATGSFRSNGPPSCAPSPTWMTSGMPRIRRSRFTTWPLNGKTARTAMSGRLVMPAYCATAAHRAATGHRR